MAEISDYEVAQIKGSIERFAQKYKEITTALSRARYDSTISSAESKLSTYVRAEEAALKSTQRIIEKGYSGSGGFFSREGFDRMLSQKNEEFSSQVLKILTDYNSTISQIRAALPKIGAMSVDYSCFSSSDYSGDTEFAVFSKDTLFGAGVYPESVTPNNDERGKLPFEAEETNDSSAVGETFKVDIPIEAGEWETPGELTVIAPGDIENTTIEKIICTNVTEIQANAFKYVTGLKVIVISKSIKLININAFRGLENKCVIAFKGDKDSIVSTLPQLDALANRKVIFNYLDGDENDSSKIEVFSTHTVEPKANKRIVIKANTPLNTIEIKEVFLNRNARLGLTLSELEQGIAAANSETDKDRILLEALKIKRLRDIEENSFWNYAISLQEIIKLSRKLNLVDEALNAIFALFFLDSSGYRMINGKYNQYKQDASQMYYHPKMQMNDLYELQNEIALSNEELAQRYKASPYVIELNKAIKDAYYSVEDSIKLMLMALDNADYIFYPAQSGIIRRH